MLAADSHAVFDEYVVRKEIQQILTMEANPTTVSADNSVNWQ